MITNLKELEKFVNAELTSKIKNSKINFNELLLEIKPEDLLEVIIFLKYDTYFFHILPSLKKYKYTRFYKIF